MLPDVTPNTFYVNIVGRVHLIINLLNRGNITSQLFQQQASSFHSTPTLKIDNDLNTGDVVDDVSFPMTLFMQLKTIKPPCVVIN